MKHVLRSFLLAIISVTLLSCATHHEKKGTLFQSSDLDGGQYKPKVDNFLVILDSSKSMGCRYNGHKKSTIAVNFLGAMNRTIPDIKLKGALRNFGYPSMFSDVYTGLLYGVTEYTRAGFGAAVDSARQTSGNSPLHVAIDEAGDDLGTARGQMALIIVSDAANMDRKPVAAAKRLKDRYGDRICIYTVLVGDDYVGKELMDEIASVSSCGFSILADDIKTGSDMGSYVTKVFLKEGAPPMDSDGDGVYDHNDKCPGTPAGIKVDNNGCPLDSDGDGVYDYEDMCPSTWEGLKVDSAGCPPDSDGDGVFDHEDLCPGTPRGTNVDEEGCPVLKEEKVSIELNVEFDFNKADIREIYSGHLDKVATFLKTYPDTVVVMEGHTDSKGSDSYNMGLSQRRAESVRKYFIKKYNIDPARIRAEGFGESRPVADNGTDAGRQKNRRVVAVISTVVTK